MDTKKLRQKILDLAIRGKLVPPACRQAGKTLTMNPLPRTECKKCWYTYVIECEDGSFYKGFTDNLVRRYEQHCNGTGAEHTKKHKPKQLFYWEMHYSQEEAVAREKFLKSGVGREWFKREVVDKPESWEPASVLLERIRAEKERQIKEGQTRLPAGQARLSGRQVKRSKKSTSDTPNYENIDFDVPSSWKITTLSEVFFMHAGKSISAADISPEPNEKYCYLCVGGNGKRGYVSSYNTIGAHPVIGRQGALCGNINYTDGQFYATEHAVVVDTFCETETWWAYYFLKQLNLNQYATATAQPGLSVKTIGDVQIPLPPYEEQVRIVAAIKQWYSLIDALETAKEDLQESIAQAKSKILDLAIHGKLVPQDPHDEPAIELLKRINPKFTPCDNAHYENVPSNWTAIILGDLCFTINGLWKGKKPPFVNVGVIRNANFTKDCKLDYSNIAYLEVEAKQYEKRKLQYGDIIVEKSGGSDNQPVGRTILFEKTDGDYSFSNFTSVLRIYDGYPALPEYLNMYLQAVYQTGITKRMQTQTTGIHNLIFDQFLAIPIELPPLVEQRRIINKVNELFQILDNISAEL